LTVPSIESKNEIESIVNDLPSQEEDDVNDNSPVEFWESGPAHILANWENFPDLKDPDVEIIPQMKLTSTAQPDIFLEAPSHLSDVERERLRVVMSKYTPTFTNRPGLCTLYEHTINTGSHKPVKSNLRPVNVAKREVFDKYFFELIKYDVIEPSKSSWSSSAFLLPKQDGSMRFVVDYKPLNAITVYRRLPHESDGRYVSHSRAMQVLFYLRLSQRFLPDWCKI
jgi:hypothetical protein